MSSVTWPFRFA